MKIFDDWPLQGSLKREKSKNWKESSQHFELLIVFHVALLIRPNNHQTLQIGRIFGWNVEGSTFILTDLGMPPFQKSAVFFNIVQKAFGPPPLLFEHLSYFAGGVF